MIRDEYSLLSAEIAARMSSIDSIEVPKLHVSKPMKNAHHLQYGEELPSGSDLVNGKVGVLKRIAYRAAREELSVFNSDNA